MFFLPPNFELVIILYNTVPYNTKKICSRPVLQLFNRSRNSGKKFVHIDASFTGLVLRYCDCPGPAFVAYKSEHKYLDLVQAVARGKSFFAQVQYPCYSVCDT